VLLVLLLVPLTLLLFLLWRLLLLLLLVVVVVVVVVAPLLMLLLLLLQTMATCRPCEAAVLSTMSRQFFHSCSLRHRTRLRLLEVETDGQG
jgi:hypothetical protein